MKEIKNIKLLKVFRVNDYEYCNYLVYYFENSDNYEIYLANKNYGVLMLVYGVPKEQQSFEYLLNNYNWDNAIQLYQEVYED